MMPVTSGIHFWTVTQTSCLVVEGIEALYQAYQERGVPIVEPLQFNPHTGMDEFAVEDEDGNLLRLGQDVPEE